MQISRHNELILPSANPRRNPNPLLLPLPKSTAASTSTATATAAHAPAQTAARICKVDGEALMKNNPGLN